MKIRPFEVKRKGSGYTITVDGEPASAKWNQAISDELKKYRHGVNVDEEAIVTIMQELTSEFNLTEREVQEYTQTLKYILKD